MIGQIRYLQQLDQIRSRALAGVSNIAAYSTRDTVTGQRIVATADGGSYYTQYLSNSTPNGVLALAQSSLIGLPGYASQKPH